MYSHLLALGNKSVLTSYYDSQCAILAVKMKTGSKLRKLQKNVYVEGGLTKIIALQMVTFIDPWKQVFWRAITSLKCAIVMEKKRERLIRTKVPKKCIPRLRADWQKSGVCMLNLSKIHEWNLKKNLKEK